MKKTFFIKRCVSFLLAAITLILFSSDEVYADKGSYSWYCVGNPNHTLPALERDFEFISEYDGFYADTEAEKRSDKVIYLTFDAGYENGNIERVLDALKKHNAVGAFFILENLIKRNPELVIRMKNEGHLVCNHTLKHPDMTRVSDCEFESQLSGLSSLYKELTGCDMERVYRPPEGRFSRGNLALAKKLGYKTVFWSFAYADWDNARQPKAEDALEKILAHTHNGEIMLLHPTSKTNADIMDKLLTELSAQGYRFGTLSELWK